MRVDVITPRTWLLATVAGWALLAWILALAGMGGRAAFLEADASLLQPLPQPRPSPPERLGPLTQYGEIGARPLFASDRRPHPFSLQPDNADDAQDNSFDYQLTSVLITPQLRMAIVQPSQGGDSVRIKFDSAADEIPAWRLVQLDARSAVFEGPEGRKTLKLRTYDGTGGEAPTAVHAKSDADAGVTKPARPAAPAGKPMSQAAPIAEVRDATDATDTGDEAAETSKSQNPESQMDAIRKRIEARRAQLRQDAANQTAPAKNP